MTTEREANKPESPHLLGETPSLPAGFPAEAFPCPNCEQLLAPTCRVCVACKQPIDPAEIKLPVLELLKARAQATRSAPRVYFPWGLFFALLIVRLLVLITTTRLWGVAKAEVLVGGLEIITSAWIFYDAPRRHIAKSLRWFLGSLFLWVVFFPWYLVRRRAPETPCPLIEAEARPLTLVLILLLLLFFLLGIIALTMGKLPK